MMLCMYVMSVHDTIGLMCACKATELFVHNIHMPSYQHSTLEHKKGLKAITISCSSY